MVDQLLARLKLMEFLVVSVRIIVVVNVAAILNRTVLFLERY